MNNSSKEIFDEEYFLTRDSMPETTVGVLEKLFEKNKVRKVLDVACGTGRFVKYFNQEKKIKAVGMDVSWAACKKSGAVQANAQKISFKNGTFDAVTCLSLIEHMDEEKGKELLMEIKRVLKSRGMLFLVTPNYASPLRWLLGRRWFGYSDPTHVYFYTLQSLAKLLKKSGFDELKFQHQVRKESRFDWPYAKVVKKLPQPMQYFLNWLLISTPLALARDSLWCSCRKIDRHGR